MLMYEVFYSIGYSAITGRLLSDGYMPFVISNDFLFGARERLVPVLSTHPLLAGVNEFDGGSQSYRINVTLAQGSNLIAVWSNSSVPLVAVKRRVVG